MTRRQRGILADETERSRDVGVSGGFPLLHSGELVSLMLH
jgi:hypothetical protein